MNRPENQVVYEGEQNTKMTCNSPSQISWGVIPTDNEQSFSAITYLTGGVEPSLTDLYSPSYTELIIETAQSSAVTPPIATSGLYTAQYSSYYPNNNARAKLVVVRK